MDKRYTNRKICRFDIFKKSIYDKMSLIVVGPKDI